MKRELRLFVALGPGDIVNARKKQLAGSTINETSIAFSEQLLAYCRCNKIKTLALSSNERVDLLDEELTIIENRPKPLRGHGGFHFHISQILYGVYLAYRARRFKANFAIVDSGSTHYFVLLAFRAAGIPVAINLHNVLWPSGFPPKSIVGRTIRRLNRLFFRYSAVGAIGVSPECERQILAESHKAISFFQYRCQFRRDGFFASQPYKGGPFRIVFAGRAEENKGILDVVQIASDLKTTTSVKVVFDVCGDGPAIQKLRMMIDQAQLQDLVVVHGRLERDALLSVYAASHAAIVPTRSTFTEGMPQVCAEAVLSGLPVITSQVANAFDVIGPAIMKAETDNVESYVKSIFSLITNDPLRSQLKSACAQVAVQFYDRAQSYPAAVDRLLANTYQPNSHTSYDQLFGD